MLPEASALDVVFKSFTSESQIPDVNLEDLALAVNRTRDVLALRAIVGSESAGQSTVGRRATFLFLTFPDRYVDGVVDGLIHPEWRTACFSRTCTNASSWAVYGHNHTGAALIFRPTIENGQAFLPLVGVNGISSVVGRAPQKMRGPVRGAILPVRYTNRPPEIDFFQSLGRLPRAKVERAWHNGRDGARSPVIDASIKDVEAWRAAYWESFKRVATTKLEDWKHEEEYRIFWADVLDIHTETADALVEYEFSALIGVVFGLRTEEKHKIEVMRLIEADCARTGRKDFAFHQMAYQGSKGCLVRL